MKSNDKHLLKGEQYGQFLSEKLVGLLRQYTDKNDRAAAVTLTGVGHDTVVKVIGRTNPLTRYNAQAIAALVEIAISKCDTTMEAARLARKELSEIIGRE